MGLVGYFHISPFFAGREFLPEKGQIISLRVAKYLCAGLQLQICALVSELDESHFHLLLKLFEYSYTSFSQEQFVWFKACFYRRLVELSSS